MFKVTLFEVDEWSSLTIVVLFELRRFNVGTSFSGDLIVLWSFSFPGLPSLGPSFIPGVFSDGRLEYDLPYFPIEVSVLDCSAKSCYLDPALDAGNDFLALSSTLS